MQQETERIRAAMDALEAAYRAVFAAARPGMSAEEVDAIITATLAPRGAELLPQGNTPFVVGPDGAPPKLRLDRRPLRRGALWGMDNTVRLDGFHADLGRYGWFGDLPEPLAAAHRRVLERQDALAAEVRPGRRVDDIFSACPQDMPFEIHRIGREPALPPLCGNATAGLRDAMARAVRDGVVFEPGQVVCVEIWAGLSGGIEDMYLVTDDGLVRLTSLPREIHVIPDETP